MVSLEQEIGDLLRSKKLSLATVESATGGLISWMITTVPGSSDYFKGSIVSYDNKVKIGLAGVRAETLETHGAVSHEVAREMAFGGRMALGADVCISDTGIAGPGGATPGKPVGLFYIGLSHGKDTLSQRHLFKGEREENRHSAAIAALSWLRDYLAGLNDKSKTLSQGANESAGLPEKHVVSCFLERGGKILILKRSGLVGSYRGKWAGVSGYVESTPDEQALVEISEETGLAREDIHLLAKGGAIRVEGDGVVWLIHPFLFDASGVAEIRTDWEHTEHRWIEPAQLGDYDTVPGLERVLRSVLSSDSAL